jgi:protein-L-isoaspartate(D-aspartate) O-methyltransferase
LKIFDFLAPKNIFNNEKFHCPLRLKCYFCEMHDSFVHKGKRKILVEYLREKIGISDEKVLKAINEVPRHLFLESIFEDFAYEDRAFPILAKQTISHPSTVAEQTELLEVNEKEKF